MGESLPELHFVAGRMLAATRLSPKAKQKYPVHPTQKTDFDTFEASNNIQVKTGDEAWRAGYMNDDRY